MRPKFSPLSKPLPSRVKARLRAASMCAEQTIDRWWTDRASVRDATDHRLTEAAREIGLIHPSDVAATEGAL